MNIYLELRTNLRDIYGQPVQDERLYSEAALDFLNKTKCKLQKPYSEDHNENTQTPIFKFCLNYYLKKFAHEHHEKAFLFLFNATLQNKDNVNNARTDEFDWARNKAGLMRNK